MTKIFLASTTSIFLIVGSLGAISLFINFILAIAIVRVFDADFYEESKRRAPWVLTRAVPGGFLGRAFFYSKALLSEKSAQDNFGVSREVFRRKANSFVHLICWTYLTTHFLAWTVIILGVFIPALLENLPASILVAVCLIVFIECLSFIHIDRAFDPFWRRREIDPDFLSKNPSLGYVDHIAKVSRYLKAATSEQAAQKTFGVSTEEFTRDVSRFTIINCWFFLITGYTLVILSVCFILRDIWKRFF